MAGKQQTNAKICVTIKPVLVCFWFRMPFGWNTVSHISVNPIFLCFSLFGLLKERPILDHHAKAHIHEIQWISWNLADLRWNPADFVQISYGFHEIQSSGFQVKSARFHMDLRWNPPDFISISWNLLDFRWNPLDFTHEIHKISKGQLPGMVSPMFFFVLLYNCYVIWTLHKQTLFCCH